MITKIFNDFSSSTRFRKDEEIALFRKLLTNAYDEAENLISSTIKALVA